MPCISHAGVSDSGEDTDTSVDMWGVPIGCSSPVPPDMSPSALAVRFFHIGGRVSMCTAGHCRDSLNSF